MRKLRAVSSFIKALLLALSLAIDVFAVSTGVGITQADYRTRARFALAFVGAELGMLALGSLVGRLVFALIGPVAGYLGFAALIAVGCFVLYEAHSEREQQLDMSKGFGLFLSALAISFDSLGIGFSIWFIGVPIPFTVGAIGVFTVLATILGFALGKRLGAAFEHRAEIAAGALLVLTGLLFIVLKVAGIG